VIWCAVVPQGGGAGGSIDSTVRRDEGRAEEQGVGLVGSWLVMHKHQYRPGYSGRARNRDRGGMIRCAVVPQVGGAEVAQCGTVAPLDTQRKAQRRANTGQQWTPHQPQGVFQQLRRRERGPQMPPRSPPDPLVALCQGPGQEPICEAGGEVQNLLGFYLRRRRLAQQTRRWWSVFF
jgi:hypothetical protein